ncbi:hypothetical protein TNCV_533951 [Trichonephila clavipes]|nr:hypothetical protein TNCV_533951 [Trichonephila clavipes]
METLSKRTCEHIMVSVPNRATGDKNRSFEPLSSDEDGTRAGNLLFKLPHRAKGRDLSLDSYSRAYADGPRNFEPWSSDVDNT